ncbi:hypothetical protein BT96DRAFT_596867 [Gymnopus androsaceus JB14]|uniref:Uncharacterized protein n=1 Tax=Gymnopus androsaceus JB14 TaxID=1447944 RepID=A0A6A4GIY2_9AGAR|nr:hypothetical protein BT96DRAFT_596867 [Gymnopus androsaceus JB14]
MQAYKDYCVQIFARDVDYDSVPGFSDNDNNNDEQSLSRLVKDLPQTSRLLCSQCTPLLTPLGRRSASYDTFFGISTHTGVCAIRWDGSILVAVSLLGKRLLEGGWMTRSLDCTRKFSSVLLHAPCRDIGIWYMFAWRQLFG